jgi:cation/acetate symporter
MLAIGILVTILSLRPPAFILVTVMWAFAIAGASFGVPMILGIWWKGPPRKGLLPA